MRSSGESKANTFGTRHDAEKSLNYRAKSRIHTNIDIMYYFSLYLNVAFLLRTVFTSPGVSALESGHPQRHQE